MDVEAVDGGVVATAGNFFSVAAGTLMYVPIYGFTDEAPPMVPGFPATSSEAAPYFFDPAHCGAEFEIEAPSDAAASPSAPSSGP